MHPIIRSILAVLAGLIFGGAVNMGIISISGSIIPPPEGVNVTDMESLKENMHLFEPKHFIFPFLAHAFGTFVGAIITVFIAAEHKMKLALGIGVFFLVGGIVNTVILPAPTWFSVLDLVVAYLPMAWVGGKIGK